MFWKLMRWGGTVIVLLLVLAAAFLARQPEQGATPVQPGEAQLPSNKNFNL